MNQKKLKYMDAFQHEQILGLQPQGFNSINETNDIPKATEIDTYLRCPGTFCRDKENDTKDCDNIIISNLPRQRDLNTGCYWITPDKSFGKGFGDLETKNNLWYSQNTRYLFPDNPTAILPERFHKLHRNMQDPKFLVMDIPRGGFDTRHISKC